MTFNRHFLAGSAALLTLTTLFTSPCPQARGAASVAPNAVYTRFIARIRALTSYKAKIIDTTVIQPTASDGRPRTIQGTGLLLFKKPNLFTVQFSGLMGGGQVLSDGKNQYTYSNLTNEYFVSAAPQEVMSQFLGGASGSSLHWTGAGAGSVNGTPVYVITSNLRRGQGVGTVTLSIGKADFMIYKSVTTLSQLPGPQGANFRVTKTDLFTQVHLDPPIASSIFHFSPPSGAVKSTAPEGMGLGSGAFGLGG